uniref:Dynein regulatory complex subunit 3 n=1 Tax=Cyanoderma ruficeps TaxID=181631 RepID=A0A8C3QPY4_9PASS
MSQFFSNVEPNIIDDEMVQKAIEKKCPEDLGDLARQENANVKAVTELQLSFKSILQIANLWPLENLTKLQLDNNFIEKIEGLESLVHLVWLDLSFNNIEVIEGLDTLAKLQDLSLYSNRISKIEHMDTLQELQIFSIGKNNLTILEDVVCLRRLKNLRTLTLSGNPFCSKEHYRLFVVAHLPSLVYLDSKLVRHSTVRFLHSLTGKSGNSILQSLCSFLQNPPVQTLSPRVWSAFSLTMFCTFSQCRDLENEQHEKLMEIIIATMEKLEEEEFEENLEDDLPDDVQKLLLDKNTIVNAINMSHRIRLQKIDKRESDMLCNIYKCDRNRASIKKIICFTNTLQTEMDNPVILEPME